MTFVDSVHYSHSTLHRMIDKEAFAAARKAAGLSQPQLAALAKCSQQLIGAIEIGTTKTTKFLPRIASVLNVLPGSLDPDYAGLTNTDGVITGPGLMGRRDFKVYASAEGGPGQIIVSAEAVDFVPRPSIVEHVREAYGLIITGDSMAPEFEPGDTAIINPLLPVLPGGAAIFYREREGDARATIKRFRGVTADSWLVRQHNPPPGMKQDFTLSRKEWRLAHRVVGRYARQ